MKFLKEAWVRLHCCYYLLRGRPVGYRLLVDHGMLVVKGPATLWHVTVIGSQRDGLRVL